MGFSLPKIKISAPKIKLPNVKLPSGITDPSKTLKSVADAANRSDFGLVSRSIVKGATGQKLDARENKALQNTVKVGVIAAGGYALATTGAGTAITTGVSSAASSAGASVAAHPITSIYAAGQLAKGNTVGAIQAGASITDNISGPSVSSIVSSKDSDTVKSLLINNQSGVRPTLSNSSLQPSIVKSETVAPVQVVTASDDKKMIYIVGGILVSLVILKKFKVI